MSKIGGFILSVVCLVSENCFRRIYNKTVHAARVFPANRGFPRFVGKVFDGTRVSSGSFWSRFQHISI